jgi:hypothetical protein
LLLKRKSRKSKVSMRKPAGNRRRIEAPLGVIYVCFGAIYKEFTALSIAHLRRLGYAGPIRVVTDGAPFNFLDEGCEILRVAGDADGFASRHYKTQINKFGWETTLFLDADAIPIAPINHIWRELRFADLCMSIDIHPEVQDLVLNSVVGRERREAEYQHMADLGLMHQTFLSSGVMLFRRSPAVEHLFSLWHEEWSRFRHEDQLALVRALARSECRVRTLAPRWNARLSWFRDVEDAQMAGARILHLRPVREPVPAELLEVYA